MNERVGAQGVADEVGRCLRSHRLGRGLSQFKAARVAGVSQNAMSLYERGERAVSLAVAVLLATEYGIGVEELIRTEYQADD